MVCILLYIGCWQWRLESWLKKQLRLAAAAVIVSSMAACGERAGEVADEASPVPTAATLGEQVVLSNAEYLAAAPYATADRANGARQAQFCRACHALEADGRHMVGPALHGFFGTKAGSRAGYDYSPVLRDAGFVWTPAALDAWLIQPGRFLPGNRMTFAGVSKQSDREDLIAYLLEVTNGIAE